MLSEQFMQPVYQSFYKLIFAFWYMHHFVVHALCFCLLSESDLHITLSRLYQQQQQEKSNLSITAIGRALSPLARCQAINDVIKNRRMTIAGGFD